MNIELEGAQAHDDWQSATASCGAHSTQRFHFAGPREGRALQKWARHKGKTQACAISTVAGFFRINRAPRITTSVERILEWITKWRGFNNDTERRVCNVWRKTMPVLSNDRRGLLASATK